MTTTVKDVFINLPVKDLEKSKDFFTQLGFEFNTDYCDANGCCLVLGEHMYVMLLTEEFFKTFSQAEVADTPKVNEVILAINLDSVEKMETMFQAGLAAGGKDRSTPLSAEEAAMMQYYRLEDLDGHLWEFTYMGLT